MIMAGLVRMNVGRRREHSLASNSAKGNISADKTAFVQDTFDLAQEMIFNCGLKR